MRHGLAALVLASAAGLSLRAQPAEASDPVGIYSLVEDVILEADPAAPEQKLRVRVYGYHSLSYRPKSGEQRGWGIYTEPAAGYLYFRCPAAELATCALEWQDLAAAIGDERCAAYGQRYLTDPEPNGRLRDIGASVEPPDTYPIGQGLLMVREGERGSCADLRAARDKAAGVSTPGAGALPTATAGSGPSPEPKPSEAPTQSDPELKPTAAKPAGGSVAVLYLPILDQSWATGSASALSPLPAEDVDVAPMRGRGLFSGSALLVLGAALWIGLRRPSPA